MTVSILLVGAGGHARSCIDVIEQEGRFSVAGLLGLPGEVGSHLLGYEVLGTDADLAVLRSRISTALVTVGQILSPEHRMHLFDLLTRAGWALPVVVSPRAYVSPHARIGLGTVVMHGAIVNAGATVGCNCIINSHALVEHDAAIGDHCHIATAAVVNGGVHVGDGTFIGSDCSVRQNISIGSRCVIGMGQRVVEDCADGASMPPLRRPS